MSGGTVPGGHVIGVVVPHAGYIYSGNTASYSYNAIKEDSRRKFLIIGPKHSGFPYSTCVYPSGTWSTPLGRCRIDDEGVRAITSTQKDIEISESAFDEEHSIEVQLPWLQFLFGDSCMILPVSMGDQSMERAGELASAIGDLPTDHVVIASSDLTHYEPSRSADLKDSEMIKAIESLDVEAFYSTMQRINASACGYGPIATLMLLTKRLNGKITLLNHSNSGDETGEYSSVVGYASFVAYSKK